MTRRSRDRPATARTRACAVLLACIGVALVLGAAAYSKVIPRGPVISAVPRFGAVLPKGGQVNLVVSKGRRG